MREDGTVALPGGAPLAHDETLAGRLTGRPGLVLLDVDGTLAPLAPRPEDARVPPETLAVVEALVAAQVDERGVLLLSRFTGAAEEIEGAVLINPFNIDGFVSAIRTALDMPAEERRRRMRRMRRRLQNNTIFDWMDAILARCSDIVSAQVRPVPLRIEV